MSGAMVDPSIDSFLKQTAEDTQNVKLLIDARREIDEEEILKMENNKVAPIALKSNNAISNRLTIKIEDSLPKT